MLVGGGEVHDCLAEFGGSIGMSGNFEELSISMMNIGIKSVGHRYIEEALKVSHVCNWNEGERGESLDNYLPTGKPETPD